VHLTNYAIQRTHVPEGSLEHSFGGSKISLKQLKEKLQEKGIDWNHIWSQVQEIVIKSLVAS
jgi:tubulin polyglutamylase TTLL5